MPYPCPTGGCCGSVTTVNGTVNGCCAALTVAGMAVDLYNGATLLASTTTSASGTYSFSITISSSFTATVQVTPLSARFQVSSNTGTVNPGGAAGINVTLQPATNYHCGPCNYPIYQALTVVDATYGTYAATYTAALPAPRSGLAGWHTGFQALAYGGGGNQACAATTLNIDWFLIASCTLNPNGGYWCVDAISGDCPSNVNTHILGLGWSTATIVACPGPSTAATLVITCKNPYTSWCPSAPYTIMYKE